MFYCIWYVNLEVTKLIKVLARSLWLPRDYPSGLAHERPTGTEYRGPSVAVTREWPERLPIVNRQQESKISPLKKQSRQISFANHSR